MIVETIYAGRDNTFSLRLIRGGVPENLMAVNKYLLFISDTIQFTDRKYFIEKEDGVVEIDIAPDLTPEMVGSYKAHLLTYDPVNVNGVRWPDFKLKIKA
jgi:hypothetical protein